MNVVFQSLLPSMGEFLPGVEQGFCVRHLYNNFRKKYVERSYMEGCKINLHADIRKRNVAVIVVNE